MAFYAAGFMTGVIVGIGSLLLMSWIDDDDDDDGGIQDQLTSGFKPSPLPSDIENSGEFD